MRNLRRLYVAGALALAFSITLCLAPQQALAGVGKVIAVVEQLFGGARIDGAGATNGQALIYTSATNTWGPGAAGGGIADGTSTANTLYWDGADWTETAILTVDTAEEAIGIGSSPAYIEATASNTIRFTDTPGSHSVFAVQASSWQISDDGVAKIIADESGSTGRIRMTGVLGFGPTVGTVDVSLSRRNAGEAQLLGTSSDPGSLMLAASGLNEEAGIAYVNSTGLASQQIAVQNEQGDFVDLIVRDLLDATGASHLGGALSGITNSTAGQLDWDTGSGAINHLAGPTDQPFTFDAPDQDMVFTKGTGSGDRFEFDTGSAASGRGFVVKNGATTYLEVSGSVTDMRTFTGARFIETKSSNYSLNATQPHGDMFKVYVNDGAVGTITYTLPASPFSGQQLTAYRFTDQEVRIDPGDGTDTITYSGGEMAGGEYLALGAVGSSVTLVWHAGVADSWLVISEVGTLTEETP